MYSAFCSYCDSFSEPISFCGLSLGAVLALKYAIDFSQNVNSLILAAPQYDMPKFLLKVQNLLFKFMPESKFKDIGLKKSDFIMLTKSMEDMDFTNSLYKVKCPVFVLCGEKDNVNKKAAMKLAGELSNTLTICCVGILMVDCYDTLVWLKEHCAELGISSDQLMVGGESAGGGLAAALCMMARDRGEVSIAYQMPLYPMNHWFKEQNKDV